MRVKFDLHIDSCNQSITDYTIDEISRILKETASKIEDGFSDGEYTVRDINGNKIGFYILTITDEEEE